MDTGPACPGREGTGSAGEPRSPGRVRVWDPLSWPAPGHGAGELCPAAGLTPPEGRGGPSGSAWRRHGSSAAREQWLFSSCAIEQRLALSEQPAVIRADLQVGVKRALKIS